MNPIQWCVVYILGYYGWVCVYCRNTGVNSSPSGPQVAADTRKKPRQRATFLITGRGESEYVKTSNAKFEQLRGYTQVATRPSERFEPRQTAVCRLNMQVPNKKLKPPHLRRVKFSGRGYRTNFELFITTTF